MNFTDTPALNSMEATMKMPPYSTQKGGGRQQSAYRYTKQDCDCRFCLHHRKRKGCCQLTIAGGFAPSSETADIISKALGSRTVMTGSASRSRSDPTQNLQMTEWPLMTADELRTMKKGAFIVMKTGVHPFIAQLKLFMKWGIFFSQNAYMVEKRGARDVRYVSREKLMCAIADRYPSEKRPQKKLFTVDSGGTRRPQTCRYR